MDNNDFRTRLKIAKKQFIDKDKMKMTIKGVCSWVQLLDWEQS